MVRLTARYNGEVLIPDGPVSLPTGVPLEITVRAQELLPGDPILSLVGLGREIWDNVDPVEYQRREREGWK